jgi:single-stranded-DNA-specific exonuclease
MGCAHVALDLLSTVDSLRAEVLAVSLCELNRQRQEVEADIFEQCLHLLAPVPPEERRAIVLAGEDWHQGVVGIVASRLSERYCAPTFMISLREGKGKGSCRSFGGFNLFHALEQTRHLLLGFGGHELAAGFTILEENIPAFCLEMNRLVEEYSHGQPLPSVLEVDAEVDHPALLTQEEIQALQVLEPFGMGNPKPVFALSGVTVLSMSDVGSGRHLKLRLQRDGHALDAIFFSATCGQSGLFPGDTADVAFYPQINEYRGIRSVQLLVTDLRPSLARIRQEQALFDRFRGGEDITREEAASLLPRREEFVSLWRYLSAGPAQMEETLASLAKNIARQTGRQETYMRTMVCLEVFDERGLIRLDSGGDRLRITVCDPGEKVDLEQSAWMLRLKELTGR